MHLDRSANAQDDSIYNYEHISINKQSSLFGKGINSPISTPRNNPNELKHNKHSLFFKELSNLALQYHSDNDFLDIYQNYKPFLKFFYKSIKALENNKKQEVDLALGKEKKLKKLKKLKRILIVDDNRFILKALKNKCRQVIKEANLQNDIEIISAYDGVDALGLFKMDFYLGQSIDYIIADYNMSMMNGGDFLKLVDKYRDGRYI